MKKSVKHRHRYNWRERFDSVWYNRTNEYGRGQLNDRLKTFMVAELKRVRKEAYDKGFAEGFEAANE